MDATAGLVAGVIGYVFIVLTIGLVSSSLAKIVASLVGGTDSFSRHRGAGAAAAAGMGAAAGGAAGAAAGKLAKAGAGKAASKGATAIKSQMHGQTRLKAKRAERSQQLAKRSHKGLGLGK